MWDALNNPSLAVAPAAFWKVLFDFDELLTVGPDAVVYLAFALIGTAIFLLRLAAALFLGVDGDVDIDFDADADVDVGHGAGFGLISLFSITSFVMGAGWAGLAARIEWGLGTIAAGFAAAGIGFAMMLMAASIMFVMRKAQHEVKVDHHSAVGKTGTAYQNIPAKGEGVGKVRVTVSEQSMIVPAVSTGEAIASFAAVRILDVRDDKTFIVEPTGD